MENMLSHVFFVLWVGTCLYQEECKQVLINCGAVIWCRAA